MNCFADANRLETLPMVCATVLGAGLNLQENSNIFSVEEILMEMAALQSFIGCSKVALIQPSKLAESPSLGYLAKTNSKDKPGSGSKLFYINSWVMIWSSDQPRTGRDDK
jgi:hypothetical protein